MIGRLACLIGLHSPGWTQHRMGRHEYRDRCLRCGKWRVVR